MLATDLVLAQLLLGMMQSASLDHANWSAIDENPCVPPVAGDPDFHQRTRKPHQACRGSARESGKLQRLPRPVSKRGCPAHVVGHLPKLLFSSLLRPLLGPFFPSCRHLGTKGCERQSHRLRGTLLCGLDFGPAGVRQVVQQPTWGAVRRVHGTWVGRLVNNGSKARQASASGVRSTAKNARSPCVSPCEHFPTTCIQGTKETPGLGKQLPHRRCFHLSEILPTVNGGEVGGIARLTKQHDAGIHESRTMTSSRPTSMQTMLGNGNHSQDQHLQERSNLC